jgi:hypothetical protein
MKHLNYFPAVAAGVLALVLVQAGCGKKDPGNSLFFNARMDAIRQAGLPASLAELDAFYPEPAAGENAAGFYAEAFAALTVTDPKSPAYLVKNQAALELLHKAATKTQCRYPITLGEGPNCKLPHIGKIKAPAQLLGRVAVAHAAKGRSDLAAQAILDAFRLSGSLAQEPLLISQLVRISADSIACSALEEAIGLKSFTEPELSRLQAALSGEATTLGPSLARAVAAERCWVLGVFQMPLTNYQDFSLGGTNCPFGQPADFERYRQGAVGPGLFQQLARHCLRPFPGLPRLVPPMGAGSPGQDQRSEVQRLSRFGHSLCSP